MLFELQLIVHYLYMEDLMCLSQFELKRTAKFDNIFT